MPAIHFFCAICGSALTVPADASPFLVTECSACKHTVPIPAGAESPFGLGDVTAALPQGVLALEVKFLCAACNRKLRIDARCEGLEVNCPECNGANVVPRWSRREAPAMRLSAPELDFLSEPFEIEARSSEV